MRILIVGTGNVGTAMAADLKIKGNEIIMLKTTNKMGNMHYNKIKENNTIIFKEIDNKEITAKIDVITDSYEEAFNKNPEIVIICLQTNYQEDIIKKISKYLNKNQILLFEPGYLATAFVMKYCPKNNMPTIAEAESSPIDCRIEEKGKVKVLFRNVRNPIGIYPKSKESQAYNTLKKLKYNFVLTESVISAALNNPNLIVHTIGAIMSIPRIEYTKGEYWMYKEVFTKSVWNMVEKLDNEKIQVLKRLKLEPIKYVDACKYRNSEDLSADSKKIFLEYATNSSPKGPEVSNSRYITEDVPQGLVLLESLGKILNIETPVATSLIELAGACLNTDFRANGRTIAVLGNENLKKIMKDREDDEK